MASSERTTKSPSRTSKTSARRPAKESSYAEAAARLDEILEALEGGEVDIDQLSGLVKEAAELVQLCREKIQSARLEVDTLAEQFEREAPGAEEEGD